MFTEESVCKTCKHAIFEELMGEYKCSKTKLHTSIPSAVVQCKNYVTGKPTKSKKTRKDYQES